MANPGEEALIPLVLAHPSGRDRDALVAFLEVRGHDVEVVSDAAALVGVLRDGRAERAVVLDSTALADSEGAPPLGSARVLLLGDPGSREVPDHWCRLSVPYFVDDLADGLEALEESVPPASVGITDLESDGPEPPVPEGGIGEPARRDLLLRSLAHTLNNPLASALGWVQLLEAQIGREGPQERALAQIRHELRRLEQISSALATIGQRPGGLTAPVDVAALVQSRVRDLEAEGLAVSLNLPPAPVPLVQGDSRDLTLMLDLLSEALLEERSRIESIAMHIEVQPAVLRLTLRESGSSVPCEIEPEDVGLLLKSLRPTRALALAVAHAVVQRGLGGRMQMGRDPAGSAWLELLLPRAESASEAAAT